MTATHLSLLGSFEVAVSGAPAATSTAGTQRLVVLLALRDRVVSRAAVAGALWPDTTSELAALRLRTALSRLDSSAQSVVEMTPGGLRIDAACAVDYRLARQQAFDMLETEHPSPRQSAAQTRESIALLCLELLPDSYDDWVLDEAEDWRLLRAIALEALAATLSADHRPHLAMGAAQAAVRNEPLRETAQAALIRLHLVAGNQHEALRVYERFAVVLADSLQLSPSPMLRDLVSTLVPVS
ncbi:MAG: transcriptional regulator [Microcella sp.]|uniref:AfsR/SARP family transcriptional regulator n=1 Tax=Microcella sp. TaxID=1913979 RepID=UPI0024C9E34D|nr:BTAD domain-containing putative transcriptional regulator [Microcella sp.]UYN84617.1 MAG: transcriptional regulator [Microcella sp.]